MGKEEQGLRASEVKKLQETWGKNTIDSQKKSVFEVLGRQFSSPFSLVLIGAAGVTGFLGEYIDTTMITSFVVLNGMLGFFQEYRSEHALHALAKLSESTARVVRNGKEQHIPTPELVPGDLVLLREGDIIPADVRFIATDHCQVDESVLTGETLPKTKNAKDTQRNTGFSQTSLVSGTARALVTATGTHSRMGEIDRLAIATKHHSAFEKRLTIIGSATLRIVCIALVLLGAAHLLFTPEDSLTNLALFLIALAVSAIPEALQLVTTFTLATGALRLAKRHVIVKRLAAIEDLGSIEILCVDKTGTLTQNRMECVETFGDKESVLFAAALGCTGTTSGFDGAIWKSLTKNMQKLVQKGELVHEDPFDAAKRMSATHIKLNHKTYTTLRGAPEAIINACNPSANEAKELLAWANAQGKQGHRVLAFAQGTSEKTVSLLGALAFVDPLKPDVPEVIAEAKNLGITLKIISGDGPEVTGAIAAQAGIIDTATNVITGKDIEKLSEKELKKIAHTNAVFARISPEQKHRIISALSQNATVGFMGEGVNDAPALRAAHLGIVVREASDIARAAADIILGEADLRVIIDGVKEGRRIFANTAKYVRATLTSNFGNFFAMIVASFFIPFLPMTAVQLLLINLLSDFPMITVVNDTVDDEEMEKPRGSNFVSITRSAATLGLVSAMYNLLFFFIYKDQGMSVLQTNWFIGAILMELFFLFSIRSARPLLIASSPSRTLTTITLLATLITIIIPFSSLAHTFNFTPPTVHDMGLIALIVLAYIVTNECIKLLLIFIATNKKAKTKLA